MLNKMSLALAAAAVALSAGAADARDNRHERGTALSIDFGTIAFGYNDGYWDTGHRWHAWRNRGDLENYRNHHGGDFHNWKHNRDRDHGWHNR